MVEIRPVALPGTFFQGEEEKKTQRRTRRMEEEGEFIPVIIEIVATYALYSRGCRIWCVLFVLHWITLAGYLNTDTVIFLSLLRWVKSERIAVLQLLFLCTLLRSKNVFIKCSPA